MSALTRLWLWKQKATLRNLFRKPSSAILTVFMVVVYGGLIYFILTLDSDVFQLVHLHTAILFSIGFTAMMTFALLLQKRKALFQENDSFYLFCGPFSRAQVMKFLMGQSVLQAFLFSLLSTFMFICFGAGLPFTPMLILLSIVGSFFTFLFFLNLTDYLYVLSISDSKYQKAAKLVAGGFIVLVLLIFIVTMVQNDFDLSNGLMGFAQSNLFYLIPIFGWQKMLLIAYISGNTLFTVIAFCLLLLADIIVYLLFISYEGDFYEQAMMDAIELSAYVAQVKEGKKNAQRLNAKVHQASVHFRDGAGAIFSKNLLQMKKTRDFITLQDIFVLGFYFIVSLFTESGFGMYCYMLVIWLFQVMQSSDLVNDLKNYQIYLIPAKPFAKLWNVILPTLLKVMLLMSAAVIMGSVFYHMSLKELLQYWIMLSGYVAVFISGTILSIRILKSRSNPMLENMMRMLLILLCSLPGIILTLYLLIQGDFDETHLFLAGNLSLVLNLILSFVILFLCKNMMNGRELNSD